MLQLIVANPSTVNTVFHVVGQLGILDSRVCKGCHSSKRRSAPDACVLEFITVMKQPRENLTGFIKAIFSSTAGNYNKTATPRPQFRQMKMSSAFKINIPALCI